MGNPPMVQSEEVAALPVAEVEECYLEQETLSAVVGVLLGAPLVEAERVSVEAEAKLVKPVADFAVVEANFALAAKLFVMGATLCGKAVV